MDDTYKSGWLPSSVYGSRSQLPKTTYSFSPTDGLGGTRDQQMSRKTSLTRDALDDAEIDLARKEDALARLALEAQCSLASNAARDAQRRIAELEAERAGLVSTIGGLTAQLGSQGVLIGEQDVKASYLQKQLAQAAQQAQQAQAVLHGVRAENARSKAALCAADARVEGLLAETQALQLERVELKASEARASAEVRRLTTANEQLATLADRLAAESQASRDAMVSLQLQLETKGAESAEEVASLLALLEHGADRHATELQAARAELNTQLADATSKLVLARRQAEALVTQVEAGGAAREELAAELKEKLEQAEAGRAQVMALRVQLKESAMEMEAATAAAREGIALLEGRLEERAAAHKQEVDGLSAKTASLLTATIAPGAGSEDVAPQVHAILTRLYAGDLDEEGAARALAALKCDLAPAAPAAAAGEGESPAVLLAGSVGGEAGRGAAGGAAGGGQPSPGAPPTPLAPQAAPQMSFVMDDSAKMLRLMGRVAELRGVQPPAPAPAIASGPARGWMFPWGSSGAGASGGAASGSASAAAGARPALQPAAAAADAPAPKPAVASNSAGASRARSPPSRPVFVASPASALAANAAGGAAHVGNGSASTATGAVDSLLGAFSGGLLGESTGDRAAPSSSHPRRTSAPGIRGGAGEAADGDAFGSAALALAQQR